MPCINGLAVHERTASYNAVDSSGLTLLNRLLRDAPLAEGTVEPDATDASLDALPHQFDRDLRMRGNDHPVDGAWNGGQVGKTLHALDLQSGRIDGKGFVTGVAQLAEDVVGHLLAASRDASDGDALPTKEISHGVW
jgi:hypothetical protein